MAESDSGNDYLVLDFSMTWQQIRRQRGHRPSVHLRPAALSRIPYLPHGSVNPHFRQRTTQPGARRSYSACFCLSVSSIMAALFLAEAAFAAVIDDDHVRVHLACAAGVVRHPGVDNQRIAGRQRNPLAADLMLKMS